MSFRSASPSTSGRSEPDESLYSRQIYTIGLDAMKKMATSNVLLIGLSGLGVEIAKNIVLAGVKSVSLYDPQPTNFGDLSSQFFLSEADLGKPRDLCSVSHLAELNPYVSVQVISHDGLEGLLQSADFQVCVASSLPLSVCKKLNAQARQLGISFIACDTRGLAGFAFSDFGNSFTVSDCTGEEPITGLVSAITHDTEGVVTCFEETRHGLQDGDFVKFSEVCGLDGINNAPPMPVRVLGPFTFAIGATTQYPNAYVRGGTFTEVRMPKTFHFQTLIESEADPKCLIMDFSKFSMPVQLHCGFHALGQFIETAGRLPRPQNEADALVICEYARKFGQAMKQPVEIDTETIKTFAKQAAGNIAPMNAVIGGIVSQEVLKACTAKLTPLQQYLYYESFESLAPKDADGNSVLSEEECAPCNSRYDGQIAVFGKTMQANIMAANAFLVGSGAIGCEMLKNWAMMGVGCALGTINVTDMDTIEKSNLNRQFLFRSSDVGQLKSNTAAKAAKKMNPAMNIFPKCERVGEETENIFNDDFWQELTIVANALDNVDARRYVDRRCVFYRKPLLESGTLGVKGSTQVVIPFVTESYSSSSDPPEKSIPLCTLKNFPNQIEHTIQWARDMFEGLFTEPIASAKEYAKAPKEYIQKLEKAHINVIEALETIKDNLVTYRPQTFACCVAWARLKFEELFVNNVKQLLYNFPPDLVTQHGAQFWSGPKRPPTVIEFNANNPLHLDFIRFAAKLRARNFMIEITNDETSFYQEIVARVQPTFTPQQGIKIHVNDEEAAADRNTRIMTDEEEAEQIRKLAAEIKIEGTLILVPAEFEKDDDTNNHVDVITAASNLRAETYKIAIADRSKTKQIAGKIIPAIATATALVTGLVCLEQYKLMTPSYGKIMLDKLNAIERYRNSFFTLAACEFAFSEPIKAPTKTYYDQKFTLWDRFEIQDIKLGQLIEKFKTEYKLEITMVSCGVSMLYSFFMAAKKIQERKEMKISAIVEQVQGKKLFGVKSLVLETCCNKIEDDLDVEVPYILVKIT